MRAPEISEGLRLHALRQRCCIQPMCALNLLGFAEGMEWLCFEVAVRSTSRQHPPPPPDNLPRPSALAPSRCQTALPARAPRQFFAARCGAHGAAAEPLPRGALLALAGAFSALGAMVPAGVYYEQAGGGRGLAEERMRARGA